MTFKTQENGLRKTHVQNKSQHKMRDPSYVQLYARLQFLKILKKFVRSS